MGTNLSVFEFFDLVYSGELGQIDIDNYIQSVTDNYNIEKISKLYNDLDRYFQITPLDNTSVQSLRLKNLINLTIAQSLTKELQTTIKENTQKENDFVKTNNSLDDKLREYLFVFDGLYYIVHSDDNKPENVWIERLVKLYFKDNETAEKIYFSDTNNLIETIKNKLYQLSNTKTRIFLINEIYNKFDEYKIYFECDKYKRIANELNYWRRGELDRCSFPMYYYEYVWNVGYTYQRFFQELENLCLSFHISITPPPQKKQLTFKDLFKIPYNDDKKIDELKQLLRTNGYIDDNNKWIGLTNDKNELATLYWLFRHNGNVIKPEKSTPQLKTFYKEFGLIVYSDNEPPGDVTIKNVLREPGATPTYNDFERLFNNWISKD